ncbi:MAG: ribonucleoside-diphosphate reductase subunit alpha [Casimicrobium sp.]
MSDPMIMKRDGTVVPFAGEKIAEAVRKAYLLDANGAPRADTSGEAVRAKINAVATAAISAVRAKALREGSSTVRIEDIQDQVELALMRSGDHQVARDFVIFRERRATARASVASDARAESVAVVEDDGTTTTLTESDVLAMAHRVVANPVFGLVAADVADYSERIAKKAWRDLFSGVAMADVRRALVMAARVQIEQDPVFSRITAGFALQDLYREVGATQSESDYFETQVRCGVAIGIYDAELATYDLAKLADALVRDRDNLLGYIGVQTLYDRYLVVDKTGGDPRRIETIQGFFMRVAMGLAKNEVQRDDRAIEFYNVLSTLDFMSSTPTLFNAGTRHPQLSSCYLTTVRDELEGIYDGIKENAMLQKFAGGLGNDWTRVRAMGSLIKGTNGESQGTIPFLKVVNDTAVAVNQGGKRKGAVCAYMETWHLDIEEFIQLRKNTGDDRRRTHDMNTANWIPDLFMKRVMENGTWTLFSPSDVPDLHDLFGRAFERRYEEYEGKAARGEIKLCKTVAAVDLWRKLLTMLFETGHPWLTFKDPCNVRSPQQHVGVVHSSNLCTEITLNTSDSEIAVCNLGSVNLVNHMHRAVGGNYALDCTKLQKTVRTAMRMLDNVIDVNYYAVNKARTSNLNHRPVGLGIMGFQDALYLMGTPYASKAAVVFASESMEAVSYFAYFASTELAEERGRYSSFKGSLWDRGVLPPDSVAALGLERGEQYHLPVEVAAKLDWSLLRDRVGQYGMRNSNCVAIAPTATISNIVDVAASIEPSFQNLYVKSNLSGEFTVVNEYLVRDLKARGLWDPLMISDLKFYDGSVAKIDRVPDDLKALYATAFEMDPKWLVEAASARQRWIDQSQSLNVYMAGASGKKLDELYKFAWLKGLKTTYYLRTLAATSAEKSTGRGGELNAVAHHLPATAQTQCSTPSVSAALEIQSPGVPDLSTSTGAFCSLEEVLNGSCESCQ